MFYNDKQKQRYLDNCKYELTTVETIKTLFNMSYPVELRNECDLSLFNTEQIIELLKKYNSTSRVFLRNACTFFANYYNWCLTEKLLSNNNLGNPYDISRVKNIIDELIPLKLLSEKYFSKDVLISYIDKIYDVSNKFIAYSFYLGITRDELTNMKKEDLDEAQKILQLYNGRSIKVDDYFINLFNDTISTYHYCPEGDIDETKLIFYTYSESDYVIRKCTRGEEIYNEPVKDRVLATRLSIMKTQGENQFLTMPTIYKNGLINFIKERYEERGIDLKTALNEKINNQAYTYEDDTQRYINEFGSKMTPRMLRLEIKDFMDCFE